MYVQYTAPLSLSLSLSCFEKNGCIIKYIMHSLSALPSWYVVFRDSPFFYSYYMWKPRKAQKCLRERERERESARERDIKSVLQWILSSCGNKLMWGLKIHTLFSLSLSLFHSLYCSTENGESMHIKVLIQQTTLALNQAFICRCWSLFTHFKKAKFSDPFSKIYQPNYLMGKIIVVQKLYQIYASTSPHLSRHPTPHTFA